MVIIGKPTEFSSNNKSLKEILKENSEEFILVLLENEELKYKLGFLDKAGISPQRVEIKRNIYYGKLIEDLSLNEEGGKVLIPTSSYYFSQNNPYENWIREEGAIMLGCDSLNYLNTNGYPLARRFQTIGGDDLRTNLSIYFTEEKIKKALIRINSSLFDKLPYKNL